MLSLVSLGFANYDDWVVQSTPGGTPVTSQVTLGTSLGTRP